MAIYRSGLAHYRSSAVGKVTVYGGWQVLISGNGKWIFYSLLYPYIFWDFLLGKRRWDVQTVTLYHLLTSSRTCRGLPLLPIHLHGVLKG